MRNGIIRNKSEVNLNSTVITVSYSKSGRWRTKRYQFVVVVVIVIIIVIMIVFVCYYQRVMETALLDVTSVAQPIATRLVLRATYITAELRNASVCISLICCNYTVNQKKTCHIILDHNSHVSWWIFALLVPMEMNNLQRSYKTYNFTLTVSPHYLIKTKTTQNSTF